MFSVITETGVVIAHNQQFIPACEIARDHYEDSEEHCSVVELRVEWSTHLLAEDNTDDMIEKAA